MTRKRNTGRTTAAAVLGALVIAAGVLVLTSSAHTNPNSLPSGCVIADVAGSTKAAYPLYTNAFSSFATDIGTHGSGNVCVILTAGEPQAEGAPAWVNVGPTPEHRDSPDFAPAEIASAVHTASLQFADVLAHHYLRQNGADLVEAAVVAGRVLRPGDRLLYLSPGMQNSYATGDFQRETLDPSTINRLLDKLAQQGLLANLRGVEIEFPYILYHRGGWTLNNAQQAQVIAFWRAWAARTGASLSIGQNGG